MVLSDSCPFTQVVTGYGETELHEAQTPVVVASNKVYIDWDRDKNMQTVTNDDQRMPLKGVYLLRSCRNGNN